MAKYWKNKKSWKKDKEREAINKISHLSLSQVEAQINALNNAFHNLGDEFFSLDKSELKLYSTLEPCPMCKGVLVNQNIYNIYFEMDKSLLKRTKNTLKNLFYEFNKRAIKDENIQDSLINLYHRKNN